MEEIKQYLLDHVRKEPGPLGDDCWIWTASLSHGYGQTYWNGRLGGHRGPSQRWPEPPRRIPRTCRSTARGDQARIPSQDHRTLDKGRERSCKAKADVPALCALFYFAYATTCG